MALADVYPITPRIAPQRAPPAGRLAACWLACELWDLLELEAFWQPRLLPSRKGTRWLNVLKTLVAYRLIDPGSEWRLHRSWYDRSAMGDLLGEDFTIAHSDTLYRCLDKLLAHKEALFSHLQARWRRLFDARFEVLLNQDNPRLTAQGR